MTKEKLLSFITFSEQNQDRFYDFRHEDSGALNLLGCKDDPSAELTLEIVASDRENNTIYRVFRAQGDDTLFRLDGYYDSWNGTDFESQDSLYVVTPKERTYIEYSP